MINTADKGVISYWSSLLYYLVYIVIGL